LLFGPRVTPSALDLLEIVELAWHDCYREITPPEDIIDDLLLLSRGQLDRLVSACRLAVTDWRDLKVAADLIRNPAAQPSITTVVEPERPKVSGS
jgi:hypothetical protein